MASGLQACSNDGARRFDVQFNCTGPGHANRQFHEQTTHELCRPARRRIKIGRTAKFALDETRDKLDTVFRQVAIACLPFQTSEQIQEKRYAEELAQRAVIARTSMRLKACNTTNAFNKARLVIEGDPVESKARADRRWQG
ncbi:hypothetical protein O4G74_09260 [Henriciella marina]|uniref:Uncharacterized protein n=1 Tax=Henriciella marina TaxID=453851 RepID=A0ABT4LV38_9PROT|nr:hypothetical protein [Henriciella marina]